jgi:hypothetical protein
MPSRQARREGKAPSRQAGEFAHEEMERIRQGKHGARSTKQAFAIGLSKARRVGVKLEAAAPGSVRRHAAARRARLPEGPELSTGTTLRALGHREPDHPEVRTPTSSRWRSRSAGSWYTRYAPARSSSSWP